MNLILVKNSSSNMNAGNLILSFIHNSINLY
jgi:hypothetical protein